MTMARGDRSLRLVAVLEAAKGALVLLAGCGVLTLVHKDLHDAAVEIVKVLHLNPAQRYPRIFIDVADRATDVQLWLLAFSALCYAAIRLAEAYGLWKRQSWAEWLGFLSAAVYLPVEAYEIWHDPTWPRISVFSANVAVVFFLYLALRRTRAARRS